MSKAKREKQGEKIYMDSGKYVNILIILNAMVRRFRETLADIKQQEAEMNAQATSLINPVNARE